ncbi:MAG: hypothetical protein WDN46_12240 [Methylocella sp.]
MNDVEACTQTLDNADEIVAGLRTALFGNQNAEALIEIARQLVLMNGNLEALTQAVRSVPDSRSVFGVSNYRSIELRYIRRSPQPTRIWKVGAAAIRDFRRNNPSTPAEQLPLGGLLLRLIRRPPITLHTRLRNFAMARMDVT